MSTEAYAGLLSVFKTILQRPDERSESINIVFEALLDHLSRQSSTSALRALGDSFLVDFLFHLDPWLQLDRNVVVRLQEWFERVPKTLWELGSKNEVSTFRLFHFLLGIGHRATSLFDDSFPVMAQQLAPYFTVLHAQKGPTPGPWHRLPSKSIRKLALDVARVWTEWDADGVLRRAVDGAVEGDALWQPLWERYIVCQ